MENRKQITDRSDTGTDSLQFTGSSHIKLLTKIDMKTSAHEINNQVKKKKVYKTTDVHPHKMLLERVPAPVSLGDVVPIISRANAEGQGDDEHDNDREDNCIDNMTTEFNERAGTSLNIEEGQQPEKKPKLEVMDSYDEYYNHYEQLVRNADFPTNSPAVSSSTTSRKRKLEEIQTALDSGQYYEVKASEEFNEIFDNSTGARIGRIRCLKCFKILSSSHGGHRTAHKEGNCVKGAESTKPKLLPPHQLAQIRKAMVEYIMKSGVSFNHLVGGCFRDMAKALFSIGCNGSTDIDSMRMPSQESIRKQVEAEGVKIFEKIGADIAEPVKKQECCLVLDFGKQIHNFLSVFAVYLDRKSEKPELKTHSFMFIPVFEQKTTKRIVEYIVEGGERLGLNREDVMKLRVVGDEAANIKELGNYFESYSLCSCQSVQKAAERVLSPLHENSSPLNAKEMEHLQKLNEIVDDCADLALALRKNKNKYNFTKLPVANCPTRWMTFVNCCQDIIDLFPQIEEINNERISELREKIRPMMPQLITMTQVLKMFEEPLSLFEKTDMRLHEVAPRLFKLRREITHKQEETRTTPNYTLNVLCKSAIESLLHYTSQTISEPHLLASILCPGMRTLPYFDDYLKNKARSCLKEAIEKVKVEEPSMNVPLPHFNDLYDAPSEKPTSDVELNDYLSSVFSPQDTTMHPLLFWEKHKGRFPRLSTIAGQVYCVISSQSICERAFSALKRVFRCDKQSMDPEFVEILMVSFLHLNDYK